MNSKSLRCRTRVSEGTNIFLPKNFSARPYGLRKAPETRVRQKHIKTFQKAVLDHWKESGRHALPWRKTTNPYRILVSEIMLQQTQVSRVEEKYKSFLKKFPTVRSLASASLSEVLKEWSGLGYNRRGKFLHEAAKEIVTHHMGKVPRDVETLRALPGVGEYTAKAVCVFAFNQPHVCIETNIRAAYIYHFFSDREEVHDRDVLAIANGVRMEDARIWHWALMDYGAYLKQVHKNPARRSAHHTKQSPFEGSLRQVRGALVKELGKGTKNQTKLAEDLSFSRTRIQEALHSLQRDGLIEKKGNRWSL